MHIVGSGRLVQNVGPMLKRLGNRFLPRLAAPKDVTEWLRLERVLASIRIFLTVTALIAVYLDPTEPIQYAELAYAILIAYCAWGAAVWVIVHRADKIGRLRNVIHVLDIAFPVVFMLFTAGPNSPFFVFLMFVLIAASFRWGFPETMLTAAVVTVLLVLEALMLSYGPRGWIQGQYEVNRFVIRVSYLLTLGVLVGYLGEEEKQWRAENSAINRLLGGVHAENGLRVSMQEVLAELTRVYLAPQSMVVLTQAATERMFLWRLSSEDGVAHGAEIDVEARRRFQAALPANVVYAVRERNKWKCWALAADGRKTKVGATYDPAVLPEMSGANSVAAVSLGIGEEWTGFVLLYNAIVGPYVYSELRFLQNVMRHLGPALYTVFLVRRLRSRAGAIERARVARELHDGAIQALISVEMQLDVLRRRLSGPENVSAVSTGLGHVQDLLRQQVFELRMLMQQMKPVEFSPGQLLDYLADMVDRFRRDTGIGAQFVTTLEEVQVPSRLAREIVRIVQEALVNVRKHSGASNVEVRFAAENGCWKLGIVDNGRGFDFSGRQTLLELDASRRGPAIIKERVRSLGGQLALRSTPDVGTELEIALPQKQQKTYV